MFCYFFYVVHLGDIFWLVCATPDCFKTLQIFLKCSEDVHVLNFYTHLLKNGCIWHGAVRPSINNLKDIFLFCGNVY